MDNDYCVLRLACLLSVEKRTAEMTLLAANCSSILLIEFDVTDGIEELRILNWI